MIAKSHTITTKLWAVKKINNLNARSDNSVALKTHFDTSVQQAEIGMNLDVAHSINQRNIQKNSCSAALFKLNVQHLVHSLLIINQSV